jgi:hypothetical protein
MPAHRDARPVNVAVGLRVASVDHLLNVDAHRRRETGQVVGNPDIDIAVRRLGKFAELGSFSTTHVQHAIGL